MMVWVVLLEAQDEPSVVIGVFTDENKAVEVAESTKQGPWEGTVVVGIELDKAIQ